MITGLHHVALWASEKERTVAFYEALGFHVAQCYPRPERQDEIIMMTSDGVTLEIFVASGHPQRLSYPEAYGLRHLALAVADATAIRADLLQSGYQPEPIRFDTFTGEAMFFINDPDGLPIELHE